MLNIRNIGKLCFLSLLLFTITGCISDETFSTDSSKRLTFTSDTISFDTLFSTIASSTKQTMIYNYSGENLRISTVRLQKGNQTGYRVNVSGSYLDNNTGSIIKDLEIRNGDSIRVFMEMTPKHNGALEPVKVEDNVIFTLESGIQQNLALRAQVWDAEIHESQLVISQDTVIRNSVPILLQKGLRVDSNVTLRIEAPSQLFFHSNTGLDVYGTLVIAGNQNDEVVLRGDRTDKMFPYLPYDRISGQWKGIRFYSSSNHNEITHADIHATEDAIICDSASSFSMDTENLTVRYSKIHNCKGYGLKSHMNNILIADTEISNAQNDCVAIYGGLATIVHCTIAQFYPFTAERGVALRFQNFDKEYDYPLHGLQCYNTIVTGLGEDEIMGSRKEDQEDNAYVYYFENCLLRTPQITDESQSEILKNVIWEKPDDEIQGAKHFRTTDMQNMLFDFRLSEQSTAIGKGVLLSGFLSDREGVLRPESPDLGCYQTPEAAN
ncbi:MAG: right-handed parallel beta-helix repeat-containing protein [Prevotella sp.]